MTTGKKWKALLVEAGIAKATRLHGIVEKLFFVSRGSPRAGLSSAAPRLQCKEVRQTADERKPGKALDEEELPLRV